MDEPTIYCEFLSGATHQPINTITNIVMIILAFIAWKKISDSGVRNLIIKLMPLAMVLIGVGSTVWHHQTSFFGDLLDTGAIAFFATLIGIEIIRQFTKSNIFRVTFVIVVAVIALYLEQLPQLNGSLVYVFLFGSLAVCLSILCRKKGVSFMWPIAITSLLVLGVIARIYDLQVCESFSTGTHFIWHILTAIAAYYITTTLLLLNKK